MLVVASDRVSVFDVVLPDLIPDKGRVLTALSTFWFEQTARPGAATTSCRPTPPTSPRPRAPTSPAGRCWCRRPSRCGSSASPGATCSGPRGPTTRRPARCGAARSRPGSARPSGSRSRSSRPPPRPTSGHDLPLSDTEAAELVGADLFERAPRRSRSRSTSSAPRTPPSGGSSSPTPSSSSAQVDGELVVIDEMLTPDSSRYWGADEYARRDVAAVVRQAVRARPLPVDRVEPGAAGAADARRR